MKTNQNKIVVGLSLIAIPILLVVAALILKGDDYSGIEKRDVPFEEVAQYLENPDDVAVLGDGTYSLTDAQYEEFSNNRARAEFEKHDKEEIINKKEESIKDNNEDEKSISKLALYKPGEETVLKASNVELRIPKDLYDTELVISYTDFNEQIEDAYSLNAYTLWGEEINQFNSEIQIVTTFESEELDGFTTKYLNEEENVWIDIDSSVDTNKVIANTNHFTIFTTTNASNIDGIDFSGCTKVVDNKDPKPCFQYTYGHEWKPEMVGYNGSSLVTEVADIGFGTQSATFRTDFDLFIDDEEKTEVNMIVPNIKLTGKEMTNRAVFEVVYDNGIEEFSVDQEEFAGREFYIGRYFFKKEDTAHAVAFLRFESNQDTENKTIAAIDAVKFGDEELGQTDFTKPEIENVKSFTHGGQFLIEAEITDDESGMAAAYVWFDADGPGDNQPGKLEPMTADGDIYSASLSHDIGIDMDNYYILAYDNAGNEAIWNRALGYVSRAMGLGIGIPPEAMGFVNYKVSYYKELSAAVPGSKFCNQCVGDPVNTQSGNLMEKIDIVSVKGTPDLDLSISYNSLGGYASIFGENWNHEYNYKLTSFDNASFTGAFLQYPDGYTEKFEGPDYTPGVSNYDELDKVNGEFVLTKKDQTKVYFDSFGDPKRIEELNGNGINIEYTNQNEATNLAMISKIYSDSGAEITFEYKNISDDQGSSYGLVEKINLPAGQSVSLRYSDQYDLVEITDRNSETTKFEYDNHNITARISPEGHYVYRNEYDNNRRVIKQIAGDDFVQSYKYEEGKTIVIDGNGTKAEYLYDAGNAAMSGLIDESGAMLDYKYDEDKNIIEQITPDGLVYKFDYDTNGNRTKIQNPDGTEVKIKYNDENQVTSVTNEQGEKTEVDYDFRGNITSATNPDGTRWSAKYDAKSNLTERTDENGNTTKYEYDSRGNLIKVIDALGNTIRYSYDAFGNKIEEINPRGQKFTYNYDANDRVTEINGPLGFSNKFEYDQNGHLVKEIDALGNETRYEYDNSENMTKKIDALGGVTSYEYGSMNELLSETDSEGRVKKYSYNSTYQITKAILAPGTAVESVQSNSYNSLRQISKATDPRGIETKFTYDSLGNPTGQIQDYTGLKAKSENVLDDEGQLIETIDPNGNGMKYERDNMNRVLKETDALGGITTYEYDNVGNVVKVTDPNGGETTYKYDNVYRVEYQTDPKGYTTKFEYDANGNQIKMINHQGVETVSKYDALDRKTEQTINPTLLCNFNDQCVTTKYEYDLNGNVIKVTDPNGNKTKFEYDALNRKIKTIDANGKESSTKYDKTGKVVSQTDRNGNTTTNSYDAQGRLVSTTNALGYVTSYKYDKAGNVIEYKDAKGVVTKISYNGLNQMVATTDALGNTTYFKYDKVGNLLEKVDALGNKVSLEYDDLYRMIKEVNEEGHESSMHYDGKGNLLSTVDPNGNITSYSYDILDRLIESTDPLGGVSKYEYNEVGNIVKRTDENGHINTSEYDALNRQISSYDGEGHKTSYSYDRNGNQIKLTNALGYSTLFDFDSLNRLIKETNAEGEITKYGYDNEGNKVSETAPDGIVTKYSVDPLYRLSEVILNFDPNKGADNQTNVATQYKYDANNNLTEILDANKNATQFVYDALNRNISEQDANGNTWRFGYDALGNKISRIDANGETTRYAYFPDRQIKGTYYPDSSSVSYKYDANNNQVQVVDSLGITVKNYDALDRVISVKDSLGKTLAYSYDAVGNKTGITYPDGSKLNYSYLKNNWLSKIATPSGETTLSRDAIGNLTKEVNSNNSISTYSYDKVSRVTSVQNREGEVGATNSAFKYTYNNAGQRTQVIADYGWRKPESVTTDYSYDPLRRLTQSSDNQDIINKYSYDAVGNRLYHETNDYEGSNRPSDRKISNYSYNSINQVLNILEEEGKAQGSKKVNLSQIAQPLYALLNEVSAQSGKKIETTVAESIKSLTSTLLSDIETEVIEEVDISDRLNEIKSEIEKVSHEGVRNSLLVKIDKSNEASKGKSGDLQSIVFDYDANGNRVSKTYAGPPSQVVTEKYGYDFEDRLSVVQKYIGNDNNKNPKLNLKDETLMSYDGLGRRLIKTSNNTTLNYVYDNLDVVNILNTKNSQYENLFRDDQMGIVGTITSNGNAFWFETDALGSTTGITKEGLGGSKNIRYSDFGEIIPDNTPNGDNNAFSIPHESFSYTGQEWDSTTGLYEFYSRAYDPEVGVWLQLDRYRGVPNDPISMHRYQYVKNDPISLVDLYGYLDLFSAFSQLVESNINYHVYGEYETYSSRDRRIAMERLSTMYQTRITLEDTLSNAQKKENIELSFIESLKNQIKDINYQISLMQSQYEITDRQVKGGQTAIINSADQLDKVPAIGAGYNIANAINGVNMITGEELSGLDRGGQLLGAGINICITTVVAGTVSATYSKTLSNGDKLFGYKVGLKSADIHLHSGKWGRVLTVVTINGTRYHVLKEILSTGK